MPATDYQPSVADVAALLRARTKDAGDNELGTFTADTTPTADEVDGMIVATLPVIAIQIGDTIDEAYWPAARRLVALAVAMTVERSYWPETTADEQSAYQAFKDEHESLLAALLEADRRRSIGGQRSGSALARSGLILAETAE